MSSRPRKVTLRYYNVGFGDCLLLAFQYAKTERFVLVDCGTTSAPGKADAGELLAKVALDVEARCGGKLHAVVATHRHKDHVEGFRRKKAGDGPGDVFLRCQPDAVLLPWTEDPDLETDAVRPSKGLAAHALHARGLLGMQSAAGGVLAEAKRLAPALSKAAARRLAFLGEDNLGNRNALETLWEMGRRSRAKRCRFLHHGMKSGLERVLPGVKVHVLGPPSIEQHPAVLRQRQKDEDEYWHLLGFAGRRSSGAPQPFRGAGHVARTAPEHRWIVRRLERLRGEQLYEVVRTVDDALNNTSLILLFQVGDQKLLFPGDAQIENWQYALEKNAELLKDVRLYKVGHHGSLNATPKSLWNGFTRKSGGAGSGDLLSVCSTKANVHGTTNEVPRKKLVDELERRSEYRSTPGLPKKSLYGEVEIVI
ncbi:MAG: hypothetical protein IPJ77_00830 [Planctomycetes bacterium]|nr:hypothetical protein [Planctomycetota bacterium]